MSAAGAVRAKWQHGARVLEFPSLCRQSFSQGMGGTCEGLYGIRADRLGLDRAVQSRGLVAAAAPDRRQYAPAGRQRFTSDVGADPSPERLDRLALPAPLSAG